MAIRSTTFGRVELSGKDAARFIKHVREDKPSEKAQKSLERGRETLKNVFSRTPPSIPQARNSK